MVSDTPRGWEAPPGISGGVDELYALGTSARTIHDVERLACSLALRLAIRLPPGGARIQFGYTGAHFSPAVAGFEGFARSLWAVAPIVAGGRCEAVDWRAYTTGVINGTDPQHPEFWGIPFDRDQRLVETATLAVSLMLAPDLLWEPLDAAQRSRLISYLTHVNSRRLSDSNWLFFRVMVNTAIAQRGCRSNEDALRAGLKRLDEFYLGEGWYSDGRSEQRDHYIAFAMHFYALLYARFAKGSDEARAAVFRDRASQFAKDYILWFASDGSAVPFGRSLTYRFAQAAFWGALAFADVRAFPWGVIKGVYLRNLRWWFQQPILDESGLLTLGYRYPNINLVENYSSPSSPYWAFKAFLPLALPATHPFWTSDEETLPLAAPVSSQNHPRLIIARDDTRAHVVAFCGGQWAAWEPRHTADKYAKFAYSNNFGFSVRSGAVGIRSGAFDNIIAFSDDGRHFRTRERVFDVRLTGQSVVSTWTPWPDVSIQTWLIVTAEYHIRVHLIRSQGRQLMSVEGAFALPMTNDTFTLRSLPVGVGPSGMLADNGNDVVGIFDLCGTRTATAISADPNTNVLFPRTVIPTLIDESRDGRYWLACAVVGIPGYKHAPSTVFPLPSFQSSQDRFSLVDRNGDVMFSSGVFAGSGPSLPPYPTAE